MFFPAISFLLVGTLAARFQRQALQVDILISAFFNSSKLDNFYLATKSGKILEKLRQKVYWQTKKKAIEHFHNF